MSETLQPDDVISRAQELETYISQYQIALKALRAMQDEANKVVGSLHQKKDELSRHEEDLLAYLKKLQLVSEKADAVLTPVADQRQQLDALSKKLEEGVAGLDGMVQQRIGPLLKELETKIGESLTALRKEFEESVAAVLKRQEEIVKSLSQRFEVDEKGTGTLKVTVEEEKRMIEQGTKEAGELRKTLQELKGLVDKQKLEFKGELNRQSEEFKSMAEKQKEELSALMEKRRQEIDGIVTELRDKHIKILEKDDAQIKSTLNALISKLGNVKFKKLLGLE